MHSHITRAVTATYSCFALIGYHQHGKAVGLMNGKEENPRLKNLVLPRCVQSSLSSASSTQHVGAVGWEPHSSSTTTCAMKVDHELPVKARGTHTRTHGLAITSRMRTAISRGSVRLGQLFRPYWGSSALHSRRSVTREDACIFFCFEAGIHCNKEHRHSTVRHHTIHYRL